jgi:hypothetical protein
VRRRAILGADEICRKYRVFCHKMPVYATHRDPTFGLVVHLEPIPRTGVAHVPPPAGPRCPCARLHGCHSLWYLADGAAA